METLEILQILSQGEDTRNQFKKNINNADSLAQELIAFSNSLGGKIFLGVDDDGSVLGLASEDIKRINQLLSNTASQNIKPAINPISEIATIDGKRILIIEVAKGINKPYQDKNGVFWVKNAADKRKATSREEIQRLFQLSGMLHADVTPVPGMTIAEIDMPYFRHFFDKRYGETLDNQQIISLEQTINNLNLGKNGELNISGVLLFSQEASNSLPSFIVKAGAFQGNSIVTDSYIDSRNITGKLARYISANSRFYSRQYSAYSGRARDKQP